MQQERQGAVTGRGERSPPGVTEFRQSLRGVPAAQRLETVSETLWRSWHRIDFAPRPGEPLRSEVVLLGLPGSHLQHGEMSAAQLVRPASDDPELATLICYASGTLQVESGREAFAVSGGDGLLFPGWRPHRFTVPSSPYFCVAVPRVTLEPLLASPGDVRLQPLRDRASLHVLRRYLAWLVSEPAALSSPALAQAAARHVHDLIALAVGASREACHEALRRTAGEVRLAQAKAYIDAQLPRARVPVAEVAAHLGVTTRYVQLLFERSGTSYSRHVLEQRLRYAHRLLSRPSPAADITRVALDAGFGDLSYFNRRVRQRYGETPSQLRARVLQRD